MRPAASFQPIFAFDSRTAATPGRRAEALLFDGWSYQPIPIEPRERPAPVGARATAG